MVSGFNKTPEGLTRRTSVRKEVEGVTSVEGRVAEDKPKGNETPVFCLRSGYFGIP